MLSLFCQLILYLLLLLHKCFVDLLSHLHLNGTKYPNCGNGAGPDESLESLHSGWLNGSISKTDGIIPFLIYPTSKLFRSVNPDSSYSYKVPLFTVICALHSLIVSIIWLFIVLFYFLLNPTISPTMFNNNWDSINLFVNRYRFSKV